MPDPPDLLTTLARLIGAVSCLQDLSKVSPDPLLPLITAGLLSMANDLIAATGVDPVALAERTRELAVECRRHSDAALAARDAYGKN